MADVAVHSPLTPADSLDQEHGLTEPTDTESAVNDTPISIGDGATEISAENEGTTPEPRGNGVDSAKQIALNDNEAEPISTAPDEPGTTESEAKDPVDDQKENRASTGSPKRAVKVPMPTKTPAVKSGISVAQPTPLVKKIINSGTFGSGAVKSVPPTVSKAIGTSITSASKPAATALKKSASSPPTTVPPTTIPSPSKQTTQKSIPVTSKPAMSSTRSGSTSALSSRSAPTRRPSVAPKPSLSSSTSTKPPQSASGLAGPTTTTTTRSTAVVSPPGSSIPPKPPAARPRASVSDGLPTRRATTGPRPSVPTANKPTPATRPLRTPVAGSISSLKEVKEDGSANDDLQNKLVEAESIITSKSTKVADLEGQLTTTKASLDSAIADVETHRSTAKELQEARDTAETELAEVKGTLNALQGEVDDSMATLMEVQEALRVAQTDVESRNELVHNLQEQIQTLTSELETVKESLDAVRASNDAAASEAAAAASIEHDALLKAKADLEAIQSETEGLTVAHTRALEEAMQKVKEHEEVASRSEALAATIADLRAEKEEAASRLSELEVEILELKEAAEGAEDRHDKSEARIKALEDELAKAADTLQQTLENSKQREEEHIHRLEEAQRSHEEATKSAEEQHENLVSKMKDLEEELAGAVSRHEQALIDAKTAEEAHQHKLDEAEKLHVEKHDDLMAEIQRLTTDLEGQEGQYLAKVDAVKAEHEQLLQDAFERAKTEAGGLHSQDLQALRAQSEETIEQLRTAHQTTISDLKSEHQAILESQVKSLEKTIANQTLELKATQDDLSKAKSALMASMPEFEALKAQLEEANRAAASIATASSAEQTAEVERLTKELSVAHDDLAALNDMLKLTKGSLKDVTDHHATELEEAAKTRAEEATKLRGMHEEEKASLVKEKESFASRVSDLEGELATLRASAAAPPMSPPRSNGVAHGGPPAVTKEELQRLHEAHNLKLHDLEAGHDKVLKGLKEELESSQAKTEELLSEISRRTMEVEYLEQDSEEKDDTITRLKADLENISAQLEQLKTSQ